MVPNSRLRNIAALTPTTIAKRNCKPPRRSKKTTEAQQSVIVTDSVAELR
jgi:hypothetical protein